MFNDAEKHDIFDYFRPKCASNDLYIYGEQGEQQAKLILEQAGFQLQPHDKINNHYDFKWRNNRKLEIKKNLKNNTVVIELTDKNKLGWYYQYIDKTTDNRPDDIGFLSKDGKQLYIITINDLQQLVENNNYEHFYSFGDCIRIPLLDITLCASSEIYFLKEKAGK